MLLEFGGKQELKRPHARSRYWEEDNVKLEVHEIVRYLERISLLRVGKCAQLL